jgi:hypothetical protein
MVEQMTENKRFKVTKSNIIEGAFYIQDKAQEYSFPTTKDVSTLVMYEKALNELQQLVEDMDDYIEKLGGWED